MPPRLAQWLVALRLSDDEREFVLGDLAERMEELVERRGRAGARRWYWRQALRALVVRRRSAGSGSGRPVGGWRDVRIALRLFRRAPGFAALVVLLMSVGIGASTTVFSVAHAALLAPLPFPSADRLVTVRNGRSPAESYPLSFPQFDEWRRSSGTFEVLSSHFNWRATTDGPDPEWVAGLRTSASFFDVVGAQPILGRLFTAAEEPLSAARVVLITESLWQRRFGGDPDVVGRTIRLNDQPFEIIGVLPDRFRAILPDGDSRELFVPLRLSAANAPASLQFMSAIARLRSGQSAEALDEQLEQLERARNPDATPLPEVLVTPLREFIVGDSRPVLAGMLAAVGLLLLILVANLANLFLARALDRRQEFALRRALGAGPWRIGSQVLIECLVLTCAGGLLGIGLAWAGLRVVSALPFIMQAGIYSLAVNWTVLSFALGLSVAAGLVCGVWPAMRAGRAGTPGSLSIWGRAADGWNQHRRVLVAAEVALTMVLLVGAGLLGRSLATLLAEPTGFDDSGVTAFDLATGAVKYQTGLERIEFFSAIEHSIAAVPGVTGVGLINQLPLAGGDVNGGVTIEGRTFDPGQRPVAQKRITSPGYFATMGIPVRQGRVFTMEDDARAPAVIVISETFARRWFPDESPLGKRIGFNWDIEGQQTIVGVVADIKHNGLDDEPNPAIYISHLQRSDSFFTVVLRSDLAGAALAPAVREAIRRVDPERPIGRFRALSAVVSESVAGRQLALELTGAFAGIALLLALAGIFGLMSQVISARSRELAVRVALGASRGQLSRLVLAQGLVPAVAGVVLGLLGTVPLAPLVRAHLYGVAPTDPLVLVGVSALLVCAALVACAPPLRRALRTDPATALRGD